MFTGCAKFAQDLSSWKVSEHAQVDHMFAACARFGPGLSPWSISDPKNKRARKPAPAARAEFAEVEVVSEELVGAAGGAKGATGAAGIRAGCGLVDLLVLDLPARAVRTEKPDDEPGRHPSEEQRARPAVAELQAFLLQALPTERFFMSPPPPAAGSSQSAAPNSVERIQWNVRRALVFGGTGPAENGLDPPAVKQMLTRDVDATAQETWDFGEEGFGLVSRRWPFLDLARGAHLPFKTREDCAIER
eukprot:g20219.t1